MKLTRRLSITNKTMKTIIHLSLLFCLFAFARTQSVGMGYPQDMFADHLTTKKEVLAAKSGSHPKRKTERKTIKNAYSGKAQQRTCCPNLQTAGCAQPKTNKRQAAKSERLIPPVGSISVIVLKVFHLDGKVEDRVVPLEAWKNQGCRFSRLPGLSFWFGWWSRSLHTRGRDPRLRQ